MSSQNQADAAIECAQALPQGAKMSTNKRIGNGLGVAIKRLMKDRNITGERMGEKIDAHPITVSKLLNGRMALTESWLQKFASALDLSVAQIAAEPVPPCQTSFDTCQHQTEQPPHKEQ